MLRVDGDNKAEAYVILLKTAYKAIHEEDPTAKVVGIDGAPSFLPWTEKSLRKVAVPILIFFLCITIIIPHPLFGRDKGWLNELSSWYSGILDVTFLYGIPSVFFLRLKG